MRLRNQALAGQKHPVTGIPFDQQGFPDFSGVATKTVSVPHTGNRDADFSAANRAGGIAATPEGMTWHHHQDGYTMQLVPRDIHAQTGHWQSPR
jgi:DNase/tRNase domain of colicin-like bacteriocin